MNKTNVIFRKYSTGRFKGNVVALFPDTYDGRNCMSYTHIGQHSVADYRLTVAVTTPAKEDEYKKLLSEIRKAGYKNIEVKQKMQKL